MRIFFFWHLNQLSFVLDVIDPGISLHESFTVRITYILGDAGADSGGEGKSKRAGKCKIIIIKIYIYIYIAPILFSAKRLRKEKNGEKSPWGQCLTRPVLNCRRRSGF